MPRPNVLLEVGSSQVGGITSNTTCGYIIQLQRQQRLMETFCFCCFDSCSAPPAGRGPQLRYSSVKTDTATLVETRSWRAAETGLDWLNWH